MRTAIRMTCADIHNNLKVSFKKKITSLHKLPSLLVCMCVYLAILVLATRPARGADGIQIVSSADGRLEIFVTGSGGKIYHAWQTQVGSGAAATHWAWEKVDVGMSGDDFIAGRDSQGRVFVAAIQEGVISFNSAAGAGTSLQGAQRLDTHDVHGLRSAANPDGRIELFSISNSGTAWSTAETAVGNREFANHNLEGTKLLSLAPTLYRGNRLALAALGGDHSVWWIAQSVPNAPWDYWASLGGHDIQAIGAGANADGRLEVVALGKDKGLYHRYELPTGGWGEWETLGAGPYAEPMNLTTNADGRLEVFVHTADQYKQILHAWQLSPNGAWAAQFSLLPNITRYTGASSVARMPDGRLVIAVIEGGGTYPDVGIATQVSPGSDAWEAWARPPTEPPPAPLKPDIRDFSADHNNGYAPIGTTFTFSWNVLHCQSDCKVSLAGKTGLGSYNKVFFYATNLGAQSSIPVKPSDTNTLFTLTAQNTAGSAPPKDVEVKLTGTAPPNPCPNCKLVYVKIVPPSNQLACAKKSYFAPDDATAKAWAQAEFPGWAVTVIDEAQFMAVGGC